MTELNRAISATENLAAIVAQINRSTVQIKSQGLGIGSGVIWRSQLIITNSHVIGSSSVTVELSDGRLLDATCLHRDPQWDLAALEVKADLPVATIGDSAAVRVGELVLAVGHPLGVVGAVTTGIIHAIGTTANQRWLQADIRLAAGNSGGPLADAQGRVIGINTAIARGLALAVPSQAVVSFLSLKLPHLEATSQPLDLLRAQLSFAACLPRTTQETETA